MLLFAFLALLLTPVRTAAQPAPAPGDRSFKTLFTDVLPGIENLVRRQPLAVLAAGGAVAGLAATTDGDVHRHMTSSERLDEALDPGSVAGSAYIEFGAALGTYALGQVLNREPLTEIGADLTDTQLVSGILTQGIKLAVGRARPDGRKYSFPSGHTSAAFATAAVIQQHFGWKLGAAAYAGATYVGASRMAENRHYFSDVLFGAAVGIASARSQALGHAHARVNVIPVATRGGAGIVVSVFARQ